MNGNINLLLEILDFNSSITFPARIMAPTCLCSRKPSPDSLVHVDFYMVQCPKCCYLQKKKWSSKSHELCVRSTHITNLSNTNLDLRHNAANESMPRWASEQTKRFKSESPSSTCQRCKLFIPIWGKLRA